LTLDGFALRDAAVAVLDLHVRDGGIRIVITADAAAAGTGPAGRANRSSLNADQTALLVG
jgi:hypothetical protein